MTTYNTYQEAKIAMPLACIIEDTDSGLFFGMPSREGTTLNDDGCKFAEPQDYCMTVEKFLADGHKFIEGDVASNLDGGVSTVNYSSRVKSNDDYCLEYMNYPEDGDEKRYILRAAALESQMNIDKLATQTPEEKEALDLIDTTPHQYEMSKFSGEPEWKNGDECLYMNSSEVHKFIGIDPTRNDFCYIKASCSAVNWVEVAKLTKPESPQQREERERLEAAYALHCKFPEVSNCHMYSESSFAHQGAITESWLAIVDKTNYRKEVK